jgi:tRNA (guanine37-N1)-methyltransferase
MRLEIVSLFPAICAAPLNESIIGRAQREGLVEIKLVNLRDYAHDRRQSVDDSPYGGGAGMVLRVEPLFDCIEALLDDDAHVVLMTPQGRPFTQAAARRLATKKHLIVVCGHYEGIDERARQCLIDEELSLGDYVLTNGAIAAVVLADAVIRLLPGVLGSDESSDEESFGQEPLLEYPQYTRPAQYRGMKVPELLLSGNHEEISKWRQEQRVIRTAGRRPDLLRQYMETGEDNENKNERD